MAILASLSRSRRLGSAACAVVLVAALMVVLRNDRADATSGVNPYVVPAVVDTNPAPNVVETTIVADEANVDIGPVNANVQTYNGTIPGPEFRLTPGQRVIVHFQNHLASEETGIHWHGIELSNPNDGTPLTQNQVPPGGTFEYEFVAPRPGIYWYHPHHEFSTNQVFKGLYGSIIVTDPNEAALITDGTLPSAADTRTLVLSDITVCKAPPTNDTATYDPTLPWVGGGALPLQAGPTPKALCETSPLNAEGNPGVPFAVSDVPNVQKVAGRTNEGQTVLTNGMNAGGRAGTPAAPGALAGDATSINVSPSQGMRLQLINSATTRFFRLLLTDALGNKINLVRVGGEGGLLDDAVLNGTAPAGFEFKYSQGEILLDPGDRADVAFAFPALPGVATLWTQDFQRTGGGDGASGWTNTPTVPVAHFNVTGPAHVPPYVIAPGTGLRSATGDPVEVLGSPTGSIVDPLTLPGTPPGTANPDIQFTANGTTPSIDMFPHVHDFNVDFTTLPHEPSSRYAHLGDTLELTVTNTTQAHHPFHLHGFSIQPLTLTSCTDAANNPLVDHTFPTEFMDEIDVPRTCKLTLRVRLDDRPHPDGTPNGGAGRWVIHCHIFFHHHQGMESELVVLPKPGVSISNRARAEGDSGFRRFTFNVSLDAPAPGGEQLRYETVPVTAKPPSDFASRSGVVQFAAGQTSQQIVVWVRGDKRAEANERFIVRLFELQGLVKTDGLGVGVIRNDDGARPGSCSGSCIS